MESGTEEFNLTVLDVVKFCNNLYTDGTVKKYAKDGMFPYIYKNGYMMLTSASIEFMKPLLAERKRILFEQPYNVYCITNSVNGKRYVGITRDTIEDRFYEHKRAANNCRSSETRAIVKAFRKYGAESFTVELIDTAIGMIEAGEKESYYIELLQTHTRYKKGYNLTDGGEGVTNCVTPDWLKKFRSDMNSGENNTWYGLRGKSCPHYGKVHTEETRKYLKENNPQSVPVTLNGVSYMSKMFASEELGVAKSAIDILKKFEDGEDPKGIKPVVVDGILYYSVSRAAKAIGISDYKVCRKTLDGSAYFLDRRLTFDEMLDYCRSLLGNKQQKVICKGVEYPSMKRCQAETGLDRDTIKRLEREGEITLVKDFVRIQKTIGNSRALEVDGVIYESMNKVCEALHVTRKTVTAMIKEGKAKEL